MSNTAIPKEFSFLHTSDVVLDKLRQLFDELLRHDGYGRIEVDMRILRKGQKEVVLRCGKEYRYVVDFPPPQDNGRH